MSQALRAIFAIFDVSTGQASAKLQELNKQTNTVKETLSTLGATLLGAFSFGAMKGFIDEQIAIGSVLNDTAAKLGVGSEELQKFQYAAAGVGVATEDAARALGFLNKNIGEALEGGNAAQQFASLGIATKDASGNVRALSAVVPELADAFAKMGSDQERTAKAMQLFGKSGASLIPLLKGGSAALAAANEEFDQFGLLIDEDFIAKADAAGDALDTLHWGFRALKTNIAVEVLPTIVEWSKKFSGFVASAIRIAKETNIVKYAWWGLGVTAGIAASKTLASWGKVLGLFKSSGKGLVADMLGLGKFGLIVGGLLFIAAAIEDIVTMCQGGESVIGDFLDEMLGVEEKEELVRSLTQAWEDMQPALEDIGPAVAQVGAAFAKVLPHAIALVVDLLKVLMSVGTFIEGIGEFIGEAISPGGDIDKAAERHNARQARIWASGSTLFKTINAASQGSVPASAAAPYGPPSPPPDVSVAVNNNFEINGATDPEATGRRVARFQRDANQQAVADAAQALYAGTE